MDDGTVSGALDGTPPVSRPQDEITIDGFVGPNVRVYDPATGEYVIRARAGERICIFYDEELDLYVRRYPQPGEKMS